MGNACHSNKKKVQTKQSRRDFKKEETYSGDIDATAITEGSSISHEEITKIYTIKEDLGKFTYSTSLMS